MEAVFESLHDFFVFESRFSVPIRSNTHINLKNNNVFFSLMYFCVEMIKNGKIGQCEMSI